MILKEIQNFDLNQIANSGQCFRWKRTRENAYLVIHKDKVVTISQLGGGAFRLDCSEEDFTNTWKQYFDLSEDYGKIIKSIDPMVCSPFITPHQLREPRALTGILPGNVQDV